MNGIKTNSEAESSVKEVTIKFNRVKSKIPEAILIKIMNL